jgi:hypothetical protein
MRKTRSQSLNSGCMDSITFSQGMDSANVLCNIIRIVIRSLILRSDVLHRILGHISHPIGVLRCINILYLLTIGVNGSIIDIRGHLTSFFKRALPD